MKLDFYFQLFALWNVVARTKTLVMGRKFIQEMMMERKQLGNKKKKAFKTNRCKGVIKKKNLSDVILSRKHSMKSLVNFMKLTYYENYQCPCFLWLWKSFSY